MCLDGFRVNAAYSDDALIPNPIRLLHLMSKQQQPSQGSRSIISDLSIPSHSHLVGR